MNAGMRQRVGSLLKALYPRSLQARMILLVTGLLTILVALIGYVFSVMLADTLEQDIGQKAMAISKTVSSLPEIRALVESGDPHGRIQELAEDIRQKTGASFVVVADRERRRFSHPNPAMIGQISESTDSPPVLNEGKSLISTRLGSIGVSIRGKTPVFGSDGSVIGYVSVGYLYSRVQQIARDAQQKILPWIFLVLLIGAVGAVLLGRQFKKAIFGLEPHAIAAMFQERTAILESIREGIIALDETGRVSLCNEAALRYLGMPPEVAVAGRDFREVFADAPMREALATLEPMFDQEISIAGQEMVFNIIPLSSPGATQGVVASFRRKDELDRLARELTKVQNYSDMLRAQAHEHSNKLHTIAGLIQLESYDEALELIVRQEASFQNLVGLLARIAPDPILSALIIGKFNHAQEIKVDFVVDPETGSIDLPAALDRNLLVTILGNLLDNAFEAVRESGQDRKEVHLSLGEVEGEIYFVVEDSGTGVAPEVAGRIFQKGVSTKGNSSRGMGLHLLTQALHELHGSITLGKSQLGGARFTVTIPKDLRS